MFVYAGFVVVFFRSVCVSMMLLSSLADADF